MDPPTIKVNGGCDDDSIKIKSVFGTDSIPSVNMVSGDNPRFLLRTLRRRFRSKETVPWCFKVHVATVKDHKYVVETRSYERRRDIRCTLCSEKPRMKSRQALWVHCLRQHSEYNPELVQASDGTTHLLLNKKSKVSDAEYSPKDKTDRTSHVLYCHRLNHFSEIKPPNKIRLPRRIYYDSVFKIPKPKAVWLLDLDSDDEAMDHINSLPEAEAEIDDFTDVTPGQKRFMKIWNHFLAHKSDGIIMARKQLPRICLEFARYFALHSTCDDDEEQFVRSLFNLMDENYMGCLQVEQIMKVYRHARKSSPREAAAVVAPSTLPPNRKEDPSPSQMQSTMAEYHESYRADESDSKEWADPDDDPIFEF